MFAYCLNNPIKFVDFSGNIAFELTASALLCYGFYFVCVGIMSYMTAHILITLPDEITTQAYRPFPAITHNYNQAVQEVKTKGKENVRDTGLAYETDAEIQAKARDRKLPPEERRKYQKEEKARGLRDRAKRQELHRKLTTN